MVTKESGSIHTNQYEPHNSVIDQSRRSRMTQSRPSKNQVYKAAPSKRSAPGAKQIRPVISEEERVNVRNGILTELENSLSPGPNETHVKTAPKLVRRSALSKLERIG